MTIGEKETGEFNNSYEEYIDKKKAARRIRDVSELNHACEELNHAYEDCKNKALALRDVLRGQDPENSARVDASLAGLKICYEDRLRELRGL